MWRKTARWPALNKFPRFRFINKKKEAQQSNYYIKKMNTKVASVKMSVQKLSGGNQQKVVIAKWLATNPKILLLDEPTRGIDVGAKSEIYKLLANWLPREWESL